MTTIPEYRFAPKETRREVREFLIEKSRSGIMDSEVLSNLVLEQMGVACKGRSVYDILRVHGIVVATHGTNPKSSVAQAGKGPEGNLSYEEFEVLAAKVLSRSPLSPVPDKIKATVLEDMGFNTAQEAVALFSDLHYGSKIDRRATNGLAEYNIDLARERLARWRDGLLRFTQLSQLTMEVKVLHLFALGDDLEGHGRMFASQARQMDDDIWFQVLGFVDDISRVLVELLQRYDRIIVYKVPGNHGRVEDRARQAYIDNFESMAWCQIGDRLRPLIGGGDWETTENGVRRMLGGAIEFYVHTSFFALVDVMGWLCFARHGHGLRGLQATYTGAIDNKLRMNSVIGQVINYYFKAHLHEAQTAEHEVNGEIIQNGCFVGPSLLSIEMSRAASSRPSQEFMFFHPTRGKTHHYRIHLADAGEIRRLDIINSTNGIAT